jgi:multiple sugar transport system permease protein
MLSTALKSDAQIASPTPILIPDPAVWSNFLDAWTRAPFHVYLKNSLIVTVLSTVGQVASSALVGYGFARLRFPGRDTLFVVLLATIMIPQIVLLIPQFMLFRTLGWIDTLLPLTVPSFFGAAPLLIFLMRQHFLSIPISLTEAARLDGASEWRIFTRVIRPLSVPVTATVAIFSALAAWNDFLAPLIYLTSDENKTLMLGLQSFVGQNTQQYQLMMAASLLVALPTLVLYFIFQKHFMRSVVLTGTTG